MKRKTLGRNTASKEQPPSLSALPTYDSDRLFRLMHEIVRQDGRVRFIPKQTVAGVPLPPNLDEIAELIGGESAETFREFLSWVRIELPPSEIESVKDAVATGVRKGFVLALLRYADELKHVPEARALLDAHRQNSKKGGQARRRAAEPRRQQARRRDRELWKEGGKMKKKGYREEQIAAEMKVDKRTVQRYLARKRAKK